MKSWFCIRHQSIFINVCIGCLDDIFHQGFGVSHTIEHQEAIYEWDDTWEYIASLKIALDK